MNHMPLLEHMKVLRAALPVKQKEPERTSQLPIFKQIKERTHTVQTNNSGIFQNLSFCIPMLDPNNDPNPQTLTKLVKGIFFQGGRIIEFNQQMSEQFARFLIISRHSKVGDIRRKLSGLVKFQMMLSYDFIDDGLKKLKRMNHLDSKYLIYDNTENLLREATSAERAKVKLEAEKLNENLIRPKLSPQEEEELKQQVNEEQFSEQKLSSNQPPRIEKLTNEELEYEQFCQKGINEIEADFQVLSEMSDEGLMAPHDIKKCTEENIEEKKVKNEEEQIKKFSEQKVEMLQEEKKAEKVQKDKYYRNQPIKSKETEEDKTKNDTKLSREDLLCPWQPKSDRKLTWYTPPKNLASHSFKQNNHICDKLAQLQQIYQHNRDSRNFLYLRAIATIKSHNKQIKTEEDVEEIEGISKGMKLKIKQILSTGHLAKMNRYQAKQEINVCKQLEKVWGIGGKKAKEFYDMGIKTVADLRKRPDLISKNMSIGLKYFDQFSKRIPRDKVTRIFQYFKKIFFALVHSDKMHHLEVVGSYRRGKETCGDIDILICRHDGSVQSKLLQHLVMELESKGFITESLSQPRVFDGKNSSAYMGVCLFQGQHHRIDIKHYPVEQYAFALMYFTGSDLFNRQMRMVAHNKGLLMSDHGIKSKQRNGQKKIWKGGQIPVMRTQQQIFSFLGQSYCTPAQRQI